MAPALTDRWRNPRWTHRWDDTGEELPRGRYIEGVDELLVELVAPRLPGGGVLLLWLRHRELWPGQRRDYPDMATAYEPVRVAIQNEGRNAEGLRLPLELESARGLRDVPLTYLVASALAYAATIPHPNTGRAPVDRVTHLREWLANPERRRRDHAQTLQTEFAAALDVARTVAPSRSTAWLAQELGVSTATVRRWTAELRALEER